MDAVRRLVASARRELEGTAAAATLEGLDHRLDEPLRVAIVGRVKAGKSTLLNALVGDELAPTDAGECTRIVTWYQNDETHRVTLHPVEGQHRPARFHRKRGPIQVDLQGISAEDVDHLTVGWPSRRLREMTLVDTPGIAAASLDAAERAQRFLTSEDEGGNEADAVVYLMRHLHGSDVRFLEAFHDRELVEPVPVNTVGVLSRADEIGGGRLDGLTSAARIAARYRSDSRVRQLCQTVVPVAGLLAQAGFTLTEREFRALLEVAQLPPIRRDDLLVSVDRFMSGRADLISPEDRRRLLDRLGLFGIRAGDHLIREGRAQSAEALARSLRDLSGVVALRRVLARQLGQRRDVLKGRAVLSAVRTVLDQVGVPADHALRSELERIESEAHEFAEVRLVNAIRVGFVEFPNSLGEEAERLLGGAGNASPVRLGLPQEADRADLRSAAAAALDRWRAASGSPFWHRRERDAAEIVIHSCERILAGLDAAQSKDGG